MSTVVEAYTDAVEVTVVFLGTVNNPAEEVVASARFDDGRSAVGFLAEQLDTLRREAESVVGGMSVTDTVHDDWSVTVRPVAFQLSAILSPARDVLDESGLLLYQAGNVYELAEMLSLEVGGSRDVGLRSATGVDPALANVTRLVREDGIGTDGGSAEAVIAEARFGSALRSPVEFLDSQLAIEDRRTVSPGVRYLASVSHAYIPVPHLRIEGTLETVRRELGIVVDRMTDAERRLAMPVEVAQVVEEVRRDRASANSKCDNGFVSVRGVRTNDAASVMSVGHWPSEQEAREAADAVVERLGVGHVSPTTVGWEVTHHLAETAPYHVPAPTSWKRMSAGASDVDREQLLPEWDTGAGLDRTTGPSI